MKLTTTFLMLLFSLTLYSQGNEVENLDYKKILIGVSVSPDYSFRTLSNNNGESFNELIISQRNNSEIAKIGYTTGLNFSYNFSKKIGIGTGLLFSDKGYQTKMEAFTLGTISDPRREGFSQIPIDQNIPKSVKSIDNLYYLDIPLKGIITLGSGSFRFISSLGFATNILVKSTQTNIVERKDGSSQKSTHSLTDNYNRLSISPEISVGVEKKIKNSFFRVEPTFRYGLIKIIDAPVTVNLWSAGLNISCYFGLK